MKTGAAAMVVVLAILMPTGAIAQTEDAKIEAQALFDAALAMMDRGQYAEACSKLARSATLHPAAGTWLNLGRCYEKTGERMRAWAAFQEAATASRLRARPEWETLAREHAAALFASLPKLRVQVPPNARVPGLVVRRDGAELSPDSWGVAIPVEATAHEIVMTAPSRKPRTITVRLTGTEEREVVVAPLSAEEMSSPPRPAGAPPGAPSATRGSTQRTLGLGLAGLGLAGVVAGAVAGIVAFNQVSQSKAACETEVCGNEVQFRDATDANQAAKEAARLSTILFAAGGVALGGGAFLFFTAPDPARGAAGVSFQSAW